MPKQQVHILAGGSAQWGRPVKKNEELLTTVYEAVLMVRFTFKDQRMHHLIGQISGMDDINAAGEVPTGFGYIDFRDEDKDRLHAHVDWYEGGGEAGGRFKFLSGTGKWEGVAGEMDLKLWGGPVDASTVLPSEQPIQFAGFLEGRGELELPSFGNAGANQQERGGR